MAVTVTTNQVSTSGFCLNATSSDASGAEEILAAPATGVSIYLEQIFISSASAANFTIGAGSGAGSVTTVLLGPIYLAANSSQRIPLIRPLKLASATSLAFDASGAAAVCVVVEGYVQ